MTGGDTTETTPIVNTAPVPILTYQLPRNPCIFSGDDQQDVSRWLKDFQRISSYNHWDESMCLANVIFYLAGTARQWFDNNEDTFTSWTVFKNSLNSTFCITDDLKRQAESQLLTRIQKIGETCEAYIQDVLALCRKVNPSMSEDEKIAHLMKGIVEDMYQILLVQDYDSVDAFVKRCRQIESLRRKRITRTRFQRLPNITTLSAETDVEDLKSLVRIIVKEELQKVLPAVQCYANDEPEPTADVASVIREEVMEALAPITGSGNRRSTPRPPVAARPQQRRETRNNAPSQRKTDLWRTATNVPVCFHCGRPGHILRYCRERRQMFANARNSRSTNSRRDIDNESLYSFDDNYEQPNSSSRRNSSPYPSRTFRRQSQSPLPRSSRSPRRSNEEN